MISIILPLYNASTTLDRCINSVITQSYRNFELICVDDGSSDDTLERLNTFESRDQRVRIFTKKQGGVSSARNVGLREARGEFITFIDADDWVEPEWLQAYINNYRGEDLLLQNAVWEMVDGTQFYRSVELKPLDNCIDKVLSLYDRHTLGYVWSALYKREIIVAHTISFCEEISYCEDYEFALHYCRFIDDVDIIPPPIRNYHYLVPRNNREYQDITYKRVLASIKVAIQGRELTKRYGVRSSIITRRTSSDILYTVVMAYKRGVDREERRRIVNLVASAPYRMTPNRIKMWLIYNAITLNRWLFDKIMEIIYKPQNGDFNRLLK